MWRLVFAVCLLLSSTAFAGESRGRFQVGITITGKRDASAVSPMTAAGATAKSEVSAPRPMERPSTIGSRDTILSNRRPSVPSMTDVVTSAEEHSSQVGPSFTVNEE